MSVGTQSPTAGRSLGTDAGRGREEVQPGQASAVSTETHNGWCLGRSVGSATDTGGPSVGLGPKAHQSWPPERGSDRAANFSTSRLRGQHQGPTPGRPGSSRAGRVGKRPRDEAHRPGLSVAGRFPACRLQKGAEAEREAGPGTPQREGVGPWSVAGTKPSRLNCPGLTPGLSLHADLAVTLAR